MQYCMTNSTPPLQLTNVDTALAIDALTARQQDVALQTPSGAPRVLHDPVVAAAHGAIADDEHGVVQRCAAVRAAVDAALVQLEGLLVSLDTDGNGLARRGGKQLRLLARGDLAARGWGVHIQCR